jgi:hypothetical protein
VSTQQDIDDVAQDTVRLTYDMTQPDWAHAIRARVPRGPRGLLARWWSVPILAAAVLTVSDGSVVAALSAAVGAGLVLTFRPGIQAKHMARACTHIGRLTVTVSGDGVRFTGTGVETFREWRSLGRPVETASGFTLLTPAPGRLVVLHLPRRAFAGSAEVVRLRTIVERARTAA